MATTKKETAPAAEIVPATDVEVRVEVFIPKGYANDEPNQFVGVNGKIFILPKGKTSLVPQYVKDEIDRSRRAEETMDQHIAEMVEAASK